ncbi:MAG: 4Fe-4S binding protein [Candidatus Bathyarchaeia archaeon]
MKVGKMLREALRSLLRRPITVEYLTKPGRMVPVPERFRGRLNYDRDACIGCLLCVRVCPSGVITSTEERKVAFNISRCVLCGQCAEICPKGAIKLSSQFEIITYSKNDLVLK